MANDLGRHRAVGADRQVHVARGDGVDQCVDGQVVHAHHHPGMGQLVGVDGRRHGSAGQHQRRADAYHACSAVAHVGGGALGGVHVAKHGLGRSQEVAPGTGQVESQATCSVFPASSVPEAGGLSRPTVAPIGRSKRMRSIAVIRSLTCPTAASRPLQTFVQRELMTA